MPNSRKKLRADSAAPDTLPPGAVLADHEQLRHINTYGVLPTFYVDKRFVCRQCGKEEVWTAAQQKWWYEVAKGHIDSMAVKCHDCRKTDQARAAEARRVHLDGVARKRAARKTDQ